MPTRHHAARAATIAACCAALALADAAGPAAAAPAAGQPTHAAAPSHPATGSVAPVAHAATSAGATGARPSWFARHGTHPPAIATPAERSAVAPAAAAGAAAKGRLTSGAARQRAARNGTVSVAVDGRPDDVTARVRSLGGQVLASTATSSVVVVGKSHLARLARADGVRQVTAVERPYAASTSPGPSQAGSASGATAWNTAGLRGAGVKLAIIDLGYSTQTEYEAEQQAGHLGTDPQLINEDCVNSANESTPYTNESHGLAVAEVAHQQAPDAQLFLYCVASPQGLATAVEAMITDGVTIASSSLGWFMDSRGDGTGPSGSVAASVRYARQHGVLWINSAGNEVPYHYGGTLADVGGDHYLDIGNHSLSAYPYESNFYYTAPGSSDSPTGQSFYFQWDEWPATTHRLTLVANGLQCRSAFATTGNGLGHCNAVELPTRSVTNTLGAEPTLELDTTNTQGYAQIWELSVRFTGTFTAGLHYDLFGVGDAFYDSSDLSCATFDKDGYCTSFTTAARVRSLTAPADSPYVLAVGAVDAGSANGGDTAASGTLEPYSSQGPTIDGRPKPDIAGWDGLSSYVSDFSDGFYGTSAAAPSVAGAAALVKGANPSMGAAQIQTFLEQRANSGVPVNPAGNTLGHGRLTLGATTGVAPPQGSTYTPLALPVNVYDTRHTPPATRMGAGGTRTFTVPNLPSNATAVALNITGIGASTKTYVSAYPANTAFSGTSNLVLSSSDPSAAVFAVIPVPANHQIVLRNSSGTVDVAVNELGYFAKTGTGRLTSLSTGRRVLDTRKSTGGHYGKLGDGRYVHVAPAVPSNATAVLVNLFAMTPTRVGYLLAGPDCSHLRSTTTYVRHTRGNLSLITLRGPGAYFCVRNVGPSVHVAVDVVGYISPSGSTYVALPSAQTIVDTRTGNGGSAGQHPSRSLAAGTSTTFQGSDVRNVPPNATALFTGLVEPVNVGGSYLGVFAGSTRPSPVQSSLSYSNARAVASAAIVSLSGLRYGIYSATGNTHLAVYAYGYFASASPT